MCVFGLGEDENVVREIPVGFLEDPPSVRSAFPPTLPPSFLLLVGEKEREGGMDGGMVCVRVPG